MKKATFLIMTVCLMAFCLCACGQKAEESARKEAETVSYEVQTETYEDSCTSEDGTVLATCSFDMPRLHAYLSDGTEVTEDLAASQPSETVSKALSVVTAFNAEMDGQLAAKKNFAALMYEWAKEDYADLFRSGRPWFTPYVDEQTFTVYQTDRLVSICMMFYDDLGGAHPNNGYNTFNFDLTAGEMITYADLVENAEAFCALVSDEIMRQIRCRGLADGLYEDYEAYVRDLVCADDCYDGHGITFIFEEGNIGPHAAGNPMFDIPLGMIANLLNERGRELLAVGQEDIVLADFYETLELWSYFNVCTMPTDPDSPVITVDGCDYQRVDYENITTIQQLRELLLAHVSEEAADGWLQGSTYRELDGVLCVCGAARGTSIELGDFTYEVQLSGDGGRIIGTADHYDTAVTDTETNGFKVDATVTVDYPFTLRDGHAVFTSFDCPL